MVYLRRIVMIAAILNHFINLIISCILPKEKILTQLG